MCVIWRECAVSTGDNAISCCLTVLPSHVLSCPVLPCPMQLRNLQPHPRFARLPWRWIASCRNAPVRHWHHPSHTITHMTANSVNRLKELLSNMRSCLYLLIEIVWSSLIHNHLDKYSACNMRHYRGSVLSHDLSFLPGFHSSEESRSLLQLRQVSREFSTGQVVSLFLWGKKLLLFQ